MIYYLIDAMVADDWIAKAVKSGKSYEQLPHRIRTSVTMAEWKTKYYYYFIVKKDNKKLHN